MTRPKIKLNDLRDSIIESGLEGFDNIIDQVTTGRLKELGQYTNSCGEVFVCFKDILSGLDMVAGHETDWKLNYYKDSMTMYSESFQLCEDEYLGIAKIFALNRY